MNWVASTQYTFMLLGLPGAEPAFQEDSLLYEMVPLGWIIAGLDKSRDRTDKRRPQPKIELFREKRGPRHPEAEPDRIPGVPPVHAAQNRGEAGGPGRRHQVGQRQFYGGVDELLQVPGQGVGRGIGQQEWRRFARNRQRDKP